MPVFFLIRPIRPIGHIRSICPIIERTTAPLPFATRGINQVLSNSRGEFTEAALPPPGETVSVSPFLSHPRCSYHLRPRTGSRWTFFRAFFPKWLDFCRKKRKVYHRGFSPDSAPGHTAMPATDTGRNAANESALLRQQGFTLPFSLLPHFF